MVKLKDFYVEVPIFLFGKITLVITVVSFIIGKQRSVQFYIAVRSIKRSNMHTHCLNIIESLPTSRLDLPKQTLHVKNFTP